MEVVRRRGTIVRVHQVKRRLTRARQVFRDERGYYFDPAAQPWIALETPTVGWGPAPRDVSAVLSAGLGEEVLVRDRIMGDPETRRPMQLATSFLAARSPAGPGSPNATPAQAASTTSWKAWDTGRLSGRRRSVPTPTPLEVVRLGLPKGVPLLRIVRTTTSPDGTVLEVNDTRMSADEFEIGYSITRHPSAEPAR